jgi:hypothetical protein
VTGYSKPNDPIVALGQRISDMERQLRDLSRPHPTIIPVLASDPPTTDPTNVWLLPDGRLRIRHRNTADTAWVTREFLETTQAIQAHNTALHSGASGPSAGASTSSTAPAPPKPAPKTYTKTWYGTWSATYQGDGDKRTDYPTRLFYGNSDGFNGRQKSLIGFDYANIAANLAGSTLKTVRLKLHNVHAWWNDGATIYFGVHNSSSEPGSWPGLVRSKIAHYKFGKPEVRTVSLPLDVGKLLRAGTGKGIALEALNDSSEYYGWAGGVGSSYQDPALIITYTK